MWAQVEKDLEQLLVAKIYRVLLLHDPVYRNFLSLAGLGPNFPKDNQIPASLRENFAKAAKIRAHIIVSQIADLNALIEHTCGAKLVTGDAKFYRFWDSKQEERRVAPWWFELSVLTTCRQHAGKSADNRRQWLREHLAVSLDWSKMNRIDIMTLGWGDEAPAVVGIGAPQRMWTPEALYEGRAPRAEYWANYHKYFPGGVRQIVFPLHPPCEGRGLDSVPEPAMTGQKRGSKIVGLVPMPGHLHAPIGPRAEGVARTCALCRSAAFKTGKGADPHASGSTLPSLQAFCAFCRAEAHN